MSIELFEYISLAWSKKWNTKTHEHIWNMLFLISQAVWVGLPLCYSIGKVPVWRLAGVVLRKDRHQTCSAPERSSWNWGFDRVGVWYICFLWSLHLHLFWQGTLWEEEGVVFKQCCFAVRVKVNLPAQEPKLTSPQVDGDSGENELAIFIDSIQRRI